ANGPGCPGGGAAGCGIRRPSACGSWDCFPPRARGSSPARWPRRPSSELGCWRSERAGTRGCRWPGSWSGFCSWCCSRPTCRATAAGGGEVRFAPGDLRKEGAAFDLAIALGILAAAGLVPLPDRAPMLAGEPALSGDVLPVRGVLPIALEARRRGFEGLIVPEQNAPEGALV